MWSGMARLPQKSEGVVLRHVDYGEADRIITLLTVDNGLMKAFARSARKSVKRFGASIEPYTKATIHWTPGRGDLLSLQSAELLTARLGLRQDFKSLALSGYAVELVEMLVDEGEPCPRVYELINGFLDFLDNGGDQDTGRVLFELRLVSTLGYVPHFLHCSECFHVFDNESIRFDAGRGGSLCLRCAGDGSPLTVTQGTLGSLARSLKAHYGLFDGFRFGETTIYESRLIFDQVLSSLLPKEPKSLKFLAQL